MPRKATINRKPDHYAALTITEDMPILPDTVKHILDQMPTFSDIVEMRITSNDGPIPTRRIAIYYTTQMPPKMLNASRTELLTIRIEPDERMS